MTRTGIAVGLTGLLGVALAIAPISPSLATRAPSGESAVTLATGAPDRPLQRAKPPKSPKPSVKKLSPQSGTTAGGFDLVIKGRDLTGVKRVLFGSTQATDVRAKKSGRQLVVRAPAHEAGVVPVRVVTKHGSSKQSAATTFTFVTPTPALASLSPRTGPATGGATVAITGSGLSGATSVRFGSTRAVAFKVVSPTTITATTPARAAGPVSVSVTTAGGTAALDDVYSFVVAPTLSFVAPDSGPTDGATVTLSGAGFTSDTAVTFDGLPATNVQVFAGGTSLTARTPDHTPGWVNVAVTTPGGTATLTRGYLFVGGVTLTDVTPAVGPTAGLVDITLTGAGFTDDTLVVFGAKPSLSVTVAPGGTQLTALLPPQGTGTVDVLVSTEGDSDTLAAAFTYLAAPTLTTVSPIAGPVTAGTSVTLTGTGFRPGMQVLFGGTPATGVSVNGPGTQLTAVAPAHAAGAVDVTVTTPGGSATLVGGYTYVVAPTLTGISPPEGPVTSGTTVVLTGSGFRAGMSVAFGGVPATSVSVGSPTQATVTAPADAPGAVNVTVTTPGGSATITNGYTYVAAPTLTSLTLDAGPLAGGTPLTVTGTGFRAGMSVTIGGVAGTGVNVSSPTQLTVTTPPHAAGVVDVVVTTPGGSATLTNSFTYLAAPTLTSVTPVAGPVTGGTSVTLVGTGFWPGTTVSFGGEPATGIVVSPGGTQLTAVTPAHAAGAVNVSVTTPGGTGTLSNVYAYVVAPALTGLAPDAGPIGGGTTVTLTGSGLRPGMDVQFGGTPATGFSVSSDGTQLTATAPPHASGAVDVSVSTPGGSATLAGGYTYLAAPTLTAVSPNAGPVAGGTTVTLTGSGFQAASLQVQFGSVPATGVSVNPGGTELTALAPAHSAGGVNVSVTTPGGSATLGNSYTYLLAPTVTSMSPTEGPTTGGTTVTVTGSGFWAGGTQVRFDGLLASAVAINLAGTVLTATNPAHGSGAVDVSVSAPGGTASLTNGFTYVAPPILLSISPGAGAGNSPTEVTLTGDHLAGTTSVTFGGVAATIHRELTTPTSIHVETPILPTGSVVDVVVMTPGGTATLTNAFTYVAAPHVTSLSPAEGPVSGGGVVTFHGTALSYTTSVKFGGASAGFTVVDDSTVTAVVPPHSAGVVGVQVNTPGGQVLMANGYAYRAAPAVTAVSPDEGLTGGGTAVTLTGTALTGTTDVTFDGIPATDVVVVDDSTVTVTSPAHATGVVDVSVTTPGGSATAMGSFTYLP